MSNPKLIKRLVLMGLFLIVVFGGLFGFDVFRKMMMAKYFATHRPPPVTVTATRAELGEIPRNVQAIGSLEAVRQATLAAEVGGRITQLHFTPGDDVKSGAALVQLNDGPEQGDLQRLRAQAKLARINLDRSKQLLPLAVAQSDIDTQQAALDAVAGDIARTEALIAQKAVRAPFGGRLGVQRVHLGEFIGAGAPLVTLTDLNSLYLNLTLPEQWHSRLQKGQTVKFSVDAVPQQQFKAKIIAIEPQIGVDTRTIKLQAQFDNPKRLLAPGMFAHAALEMEPEQNVVSVPVIAIDFSIHGDSVYRIEKQKAEAGEQLIAKRVLVQTDGRYGERTIVRGGVKAGDTIVTSGQLKLSDGMAVKIVASTVLEDAAKKMQDRPE